MKVCLDAGHANTTPGKRTPKFDDGTFIHEAEQNYPIMFKVADYLKFNGIEVVITNENINYDMSLKDRVKVANINNVDIFISIHKNAYKGEWQTSAKGISTYIHKKGYNAEKLADKLQAHLIKDTNMRNRGVKEWERLYVTKYTSMPATLVELGFMDYREEAEQMKNPLWQNKFAKAITKGICEYFGKVAAFQVEIDELKKANSKIKKLKQKLEEMRNKYNSLKAEILKSIKRWS